MPKTRVPYSPEFRCQMVELVRAGRDPDDFAREFEPTAAMAESFFSTLETELLSRRRFTSQAEARMACCSYIEG